MKTVLPSLKPPVPQMYKSNVVYQIECPGAYHAMLAKQADKCNGALQSI